MSRLESLARAYPRTANAFVVGFTIAFLATLSSCAPATQQPVRIERVTVVEIDNQNTRDATIYMEIDGMRRRVASVVAMSTGHALVPTGDLERAARITFHVRLFPQGNTRLLPLELHYTRGRAVRIQVASQFSTSTIWQ